MLKLFLRTVLLYFFLIFIMRMMGKRQIGQLQPGELVITILISEIAAIPMEDAEMPLYRALIPVVILALLEIIMSFVSLKSVRFRNFFQGHAIVVIKNGVIDRRQLKRLRYSVDDLLESLRQKDVFYVEDVLYAVAETDGTLSVLLRSEKRTASAEDVDAQPDNRGLPRILISDGRMITAQIDKSNMTVNDVENILKKKKLTVGEVLLFTADENGNINVIEK